MKVARVDAYCARRSTITLILAGAFLCGFVTQAQAQTPAGLEMESKRMADGKLWTSKNLSFDVPESYCYDDSTANCVRYGRLYSWQAAITACQRLGDGWRLPSDQDWLDLARRYGGVRADGEDRAKAAYHALTAGGASAFEALLGGGRSRSAGYARIDAHGFYWTGTQAGSGRAWFYNFGKNAQSLNRHSDGDMSQAYSVRCVRG